MLHSSAPERLFVCLGLGLFSQLAGQPSAKCVLKLALSFFSFTHSWVRLCIAHTSVYVAPWMTYNVCVPGCTCVCARGNQRLTSGIIFDRSPPCILRQGLTLDLELADLASAATQCVPGNSPVSTSQVLGFIGVPRHPCALSVWTQVLTLGLQALCPLSLLPSP